VQRRSVPNPDTRFNSAQSALAIVYKIRSEGNMWKAACGKGAEIRSEYEIRSEGNMWWPEGGPVRG
jgi:hypothetical protein